MINETYEKIINGLLENQFVIIDDFLDSLLVQNLSDTFDNRYAASAFKKAGISKDSLKDALIRGDEILWLEKHSEIESELTFQKKLKDFVQYLNATCYLGLKDFEVHYAKYPIGTFYKKHLDRFSNDSGRYLSVVFYLNENWKDTEGGELLLYLENENLKILPEIGKLVCFMADKIEHEVLPATRERRSITGWIKR